MFLCSIYRRIISGCLDSNKEVPPRLLAHLQKCSACREFHDAAVELSERLSIEASGERQPSSPFLQGRIFAALDEDHPRPVRAAFRPVWLAAAATIALVLAGVFFLNSRPIPDEPTQASQSLPESASKAAAILAATVPLPTRDEFREWTQKLNQPLETELQSVIRDARSAIDLLAYNFLPDSRTDLP